MSFTYRNYITAEVLTCNTPDSKYSRYSLNPREHSPHSISKWLRADTALLNYSELHFQGTLKGYTVPFKQVTES